MIFQHTWQAVVEGKKNQTRRLVKPGEFYWYDFATLAGGHHGVFAWIDDELNDARGVYRCKKTYAVQPGRGKPTIIYNPDHPCYGIDIIQPGDNHYKYAKEGTWGYQGQGYLEARILITDIRREDVREISEADVIAEGFNNRGAFFDVWLAMHDTPAAKIYSSHAIIPDARNYLRTRPAEHYQAWVLTFELVRG